MKTSIQNCLNDIRFWILIFFLLRLYGITDPPLEIAHNWRQTTGNMVARNFYEVDNNIFFPRLDMAGDKTGITGTEFSTLNYLTYLFSLLFGFHDWFGRVINLLVSSIGVYYFYKLLRLKFDERLSVLAAYLLLISDWLIYSRKAMPDTFSTSLVIISLYYAFRYFENYSRKALWAYFFFALWGVLSKIPAAFLLVLLYPVLINKEIPLRFRTYFVGVSILWMIPVGIWYFYWVPYLVGHFGFSHYYMGVSMQLGLWQLGQDAALVAEKFYYEALKFTGFIAFIAGCILAYKRREKALLQFLSLTLFSFFLFMMKAGGNFALHSYYIIPFVPVMCVFIAYLLTTVKKQWVFTVLLLSITIENIANQQHDFFLKKSEKYKLLLETIADEVCRKNDLIAINSGENPQQLYLAHRKGWIITTSAAKDLGVLKELRKHHCKFLFINKHELSGGEVFPVLPVVFNNADFWCIA